MLPEGVTVGRHTYGYGPATFRVFTEGGRIVVGAFCSISDEARVLGGGEHAMDRVSSYALSTLLWDPEGRNRVDARDVGVTEIGNDVYVGVGAIVLGGVHVGDGAVIGAGAVVAKDVPPYAVVIGNPAQIHHYRFDEETRGRLLALRWWEWSDAVMRERQDWFMADVATFLRESEARA